MSTFMNASYVAADAACPTVLAPCLVWFDLKC